MCIDGYFLNFSFKIDEEKNYVRIKDKRTMLDTFVVEVQTAACCAHSAVCMADDLASLSFGTLHEGPACESPASESTSSSESSNAIRRDFYNRARTSKLVPEGEN